MDTKKEVATAIGTSHDTLHKVKVIARERPYNHTVTMSFKSKEVADWIDTNQLGRRNLTPDQMSLLRGRRYNRVKKVQGFQDAGPGRGKTIPQNEGMFSTAEKLASQHGVSRATIERDGQFARAVETVKMVDPEIERKIITNEAPPKSVIIEAADHNI